MPSKVPDVIDYLVAAFQAAATIGQASPPVNVIDGPKVTADPGPLALWVGVDDITGGMPVAADSIQVLAGLKPRAQEQLSVPCTAQAKSGSDDVRALRVAVNGIVAAVEALVAADPRLGGTVAGRPAVTGAQWRQGPSGAGMAARVTFTIDAAALTEP